MCLAWRLPGPLFTCKAAMFLAESASRTPAASHGGIFLKKHP